MREELEENEPHRLHIDLSSANEPAQEWLDEMAAKYPGYGSDPEVTAAYDAEYKMWREAQIMRAATEGDLHANYQPSAELQARINQMMENMRRNRGAMGASLLGVGEAVTVVSGSLAEFNRAIRGGEDVNDVKAAMKCSQPPIGCGADLGPDYQFRDLKSAREYQITALCQPCQDKAFAPWDEEEDEVDLFDLLSRGMDGGQGLEDPF